MKVLLTGSNGLLGQKLASLLLTDEAIEPILTARGNLSTPVGRGQFFPLDITDRESVVSTLEKTRPDVVVNSAAMTLVDQCETHQEDCWRINVEAVSHLIEACRKINGRLIHVSTDFVFDGTNGPLDETARPNPVNYYGETKLEGEKLVQASDISWCVIRTVLVYGITHDMSRSNIVLWVKDSLEAGKAIRVVNDQWRTPTLAEDLAMGCYLAIKKNATGIYHISGKDFMTPYDLALKTAEFFNLDKRLISATNSQEFRQPARRPLRTGFVIDKARKELGYEPHSFDDALHVIARQIHSHIL